MTKSILCAALFAALVGAAHAQRVSDDMVKIGVLRGEF